MEHIDVVFKLRMHIKVSILGVKTTRCIFVAQPWIQQIVEFALNSYDDPYSAASAVGYDLLGLSVNYNQEGAIWLTA